MNIPPELVKYSSATDPGVLVAYNRYESVPYILNIPEDGEVESLIAAFEQGMLQLFWEKVVMTPSPYQEGMTMGLKSTTQGHALVKPWEVLYSLTGERLSDERSEMGRAKIAVPKLRQFSLAELQNALRRMTPSSISEAIPLLTSNGEIYINAKSLMDVWKGALGYEEFVTKIWGLALSDVAYRRIVVCLLIQMRSRGWLVCPISIVKMIGDLVRTKNTWDKKPLAHLSASLEVLYNTLMPVKGEWKDRGEKAVTITRVSMAVLCSTLTDVEHLTMSFVEDVLSVISGKANGCALLRSHWTALCSALGPGAMAVRKQNNHLKELQNRCPKDPRLDDWVGLLAEQCKLYTGGNLDPVYKSYAVCLNWLYSLESVPAPRDVQRRQIRDDLNPDAKTFCAFIRDEKGFSSAKLMNEPLLHLEKVYENLRTQAEENGELPVVNPIRYELDKFSESSRKKPNVTHRARIPEWIMDELKRFIVVQDPRTGEYDWSMSVREMGETVSYLTPEGETVFNPIRPAIIYLMLVYPLRSNQVRWLDSGELDQVVYDFASGVFVENLNGKKNRDAGCLQPSLDGAAIDFQVAINKTKLAKRMRSNFTIPYTTPECLWVINEVLQWQAKYGTKPCLVKEVSEPYYEKRRQQAAACFYPSICCLFRDSSQEGNYPPSPTQLKHFWNKLCHEWDDANLKWRSPKTGRLEPRKGVPKLSRMYKYPSGKRVEPVSYYDLHSLRVAGVSSLIDAGLPLAMVASIAGHSTLAMTLHYYKAEQSALRVALKDAFNKISTLEGYEEISAKINDVDNLENWFRAAPEGLKALRDVHSRQMAKIFTFGICPGMPCNKGLSKEHFNDHGRAVPGARCPLCEFYVYGPAFLPGMLQEANCLLYSLQEKAELQLAIRERMMAAEDEEDITLFNMLQSEAEQLEDDAKLDMKELLRLHDYIRETLEMINDNGEANALIVQGDVTQVEVAIERMSQFAFWHDLVAMSDVLPVNRRTEPDRALMRMQDKILGCLAKNGVEPFLLTLPSQLKRALTLQFAEVLESVTPDQDQLDQILEGKIPLASKPVLQDGITKLIEHAKNPFIGNNGYTQSALPMDE